LVSSFPSRIFAFSSLFLFLFLFLFLSLSLSISFILFLSVLIVVVSKTRGVANHSPEEVDVWQNVEERGDVTTVRSNPTHSSQREER
jgi:hypothetical protein